MDLLILIEYTTSLIKLEIRYLFSSSSDIDSIIIFSYYL